MKLGKAPLVTQYLGGEGGTRHFFLLILQRFSNIGRAPTPPPPPARPPCSALPGSGGTSWDIYVQPSVNLLQYNYSFFPRTIRGWNLLPINVASAKNLHDFKSAAMPKYYNINAGPWTPKEALTYCLSILDISES